MDYCSLQEPTSIDQYYSYPNYTYAPFLNSSRYIREKAIYIGLVCTFKNRKYMQRRIDEMARSTHWIDIQIITRSIVWDFIRIEVYMCLHGDHGRARNH